MGRRIMIHLGLSGNEKAMTIKRYLSENDIDKIYILGPVKFAFDCDCEADWVDWPDLIRYVYYYPMLRDINHRTLVVVNECLRTQNRYDLTYNCIRNYLNQTEHRIIFQYLPIIEKAQDFLTLFDFDTRSKWKMQPIENIPLRESDIAIAPIGVNFQKIDIPTTDDMKSRYAKAKDKLIGEIGIRDPHTIPRNLYLISGKAKVPYTGNGQYVGRNNRFKLRLRTYKEESFSGAYTVFEFPHNHINFNDFLTLSGQVEVPVLVADLKVDDWYYNRYLTWTEELRNAYTILR